MEEEEELVLRQQWRARVLLNLECLFGMTLWGELMKWWEGLSRSVTPKDHHCPRANVRPQSSILEVYL